jgi:hypothetical protein
MEKTLSIAALLITINISAQKNYSVNALPPQAETAALQVEWGTNPGIFYNLQEYIDTSRTNFYSDTVDFTSVDTLILSPNSISIDYVRGLTDSIATLRALIENPGARMASAQSVEYSAESNVIVVPTWAGSSLLCAFIFSIVLSIKLLLKEKKNGED